MKIKGRLIVFILVMLFTLNISIGPKSIYFDSKKAYADTSYTFSYTGNVQSTTLKRGKYLFECFGAQGGDSGGGKGGYTKGVIFLQNETTIYIYVGQKGMGSNPNENAPGGWNGGGNGGTNTDCPSSASGGGATDLRLVNGNWNDSTSKKSRIMVAGGGGGGNTYRGDIIGGAGGFLGANASNFGLTVYGGTQTAGGASGTGGTSGGFGYGGNGCNSIYGSRITGGGGGGGYYGGGGGTAYSNDMANSYRCSGGAGGSSFISGHTECNAVDLNGNPTGQSNHFSGLIFSQTEMQQGVQSGNGLVKITLINTPILTLEAPSNNETFNTIMELRGTVTNTDIEKISFKYQIDNGSEKTTLAKIISNGNDMSFTINNIELRALSNGYHIFTFWISDDSGALSDKIIINFKKIDAVKLNFLTSLRTSAELNISDIDILNTQYQISCNNSYVTEEGTLTKTPVWIKRADNAVTSSAINVKGLDPNTNYTFKLKARHQDEIEGITYNSVECVTKPEPLSISNNISSNTYSNKIILSWYPVTDAKHYEIEADGVITTTNALSFTHNALQPNTKHTYRVRAKNNNSESEWSTPIKVSTKKALPAVPTNITSSAIGTAISIDWDSVTGATSYELELDGNIVKTVLKTSYTYTGLKPNTQHTYRVKNIGVDGVSAWSPLQTIKTTDGLITTTPQNITSNATNNTVTLNWDAVSDAEAYDITPILVDGSDGAAIDNNDLTTCEFRGLLLNTTYKYRVRAKNSAGVGPWSSDIQIVTQLLDTPQNIVFEKSDTSIKFTWDQVTGADSYELLYYQINQEGGVSNSGISVNVPTGTSITLDGLIPCTEYSYSIRAKSSEGYSGWREELSVFTLPKKPAIPQNINASVSDTKIIINWTGLQDSEVVGYDIELDGVILENDTEITYLHEGLAPYSIHTYKVRARNDLVEGDWSTVSSIRTLPAKPESPRDITVKSTQTGASLSWKPELGAKCYDIYVFKLDDNDNEVKVEEINNIEECTYTHRRQTKGEEYRYRIRTRNIQGISAWSGDIINNAIKAECKKNNTIDLGLTATDVVDFSSYEMVVTYNLGVAEIADLSTLTGKPELSVGKIEGTGITIKEFSQGRIVFVVDKAVTPGEAWTGVINGIKFKAKETGGTTITYTVFIKQQ